MKKRLISLICIISLFSISSVSSAKLLTSSLSGLTKTGTITFPLAISVFENKNSRFGDSLTFEKERNSIVSIYNELQIERDTVDKESRSNTIIVSLDLRMPTTFTCTQQEAREAGMLHYADTIQALLVKYPHASGDIDDKEFQTVAMTNALTTNDQKGVEFAKFLDIYENYTYNDEMIALAEKVENMVFSSVEDFLLNEDFALLYHMMPTTIAATQQTESTNKNGNIISPNALSYYYPDDAAKYAAKWWNKTNNTDYSYYARYYNHPTPYNDNMWSGGTGNDHRNWQDCANFVSQCLYAGGAPEVGINLTYPGDIERWFYSFIRPSYSWGGANNFMQHWADRVGTRSSATSTKKGDPVSLDFSGDGIADHTVLITSVASTSLSDMKYACHTADQYEATGKSLQTLYNTYEWVWVYAIS